MERIIRKAALTDLATVVDLINSGRSIMRDNGNMHQWDGNYPPVDLLRDDIEKGYCHLLIDDDVAIATFALIPGPDVTYARIYDGTWVDVDKPYYVIHRVASLRGYHGNMRDILDFCFKVTDNIRIDTHKDNAPMRHCLLKYGFRYCGIIHLLDGDDRVAYQKCLS